MVPTAQSDISLIIFRSTLYYSFITINAVNYFMNITLFLSVISTIFIIGFVLIMSYKTDKINYDPKTNHTSKSLKSLAFIQFILAPIITYVAVTQQTTLYLFLFNASLLVITGLGFFHRSKFWGYYASLSLSFIFLILSISFGKYYFQQLNTAINLVFMVSVLYAFSLNMLLLTLYKNHFAHNTVAHFKNPFNVNSPENARINKNSFSYRILKYINNTRLSSSFAVALIIFLIILLIFIWPLYLTNNKLV